MKKQKVRHVNDFVPRSAMKAVPLSKKYEILWNRFKSKYGGHRTWIKIRVSENKVVQSWITLREIMRVTEEGYDNEKEKAEVKDTKTNTE